MEEVRDDDWRPLALPGAILLSAIILAGVMLYSTHNITGQIYSLEATLKTIKLSGGSGGAVIAPTPTPAQQGGSGSGGTAGTAIDISGRPFRGAADAPVTIVEFSDFQCPFCGRAAGTIEQLLNEYPGKIKLVYMNFPLSFHPNAQKAAEAFECAAEQGKAYEMHDKMFANQNALSVENLEAYAEQLGMDKTAFSNCLRNGEKAQAVSAQVDLGTQYGVDGTPTFFINGKKVVGAQPIDVFRNAVNEALKQ